MTTPSYAVQQIRRDGPNAYEPECSRTTHRLQKAVAVLIAGGAAWHNHEHAGDCPREPGSLQHVAFSYKARVVCTCGRDGRPGHWDAWVTDEMIQTAYSLAHQMVARRAAAHHHTIDEARASRA